MSDIVDWLKDCVFDYDELDDERLGLVAESEVTRRCKEAAAEIERLRGLLADVQIILDSHNNIVGNLNGEITRLRGLLRETLEDGYIHVPYGASHEDVSAIRDFEKRVREALGE